MLAQLSSAAVVGIDAIGVTIEVDIAPRGLPSCTIVGLPDKAVEESKERVRSALVNSGAEFPAKRITINLAPADLPKNGSMYDVPIAVGMLIASGQIEKLPPSILLVGELSLDGKLREVPGMVAIAAAAHRLGSTTLIVPPSSAEEAALVPGCTILAPQSLSQLILHLRGVDPLSAFIASGLPHRTAQSSGDFSDVVGQEQAKRALEIAAAGGHNVLFKGLPGAGKTMLARLLPTILPDLTDDESIEVTKIYSVSGSLGDNKIVRHRPFRSPHHTTSQIGLIGGGRNPQPGEISLAHRGVLFLDEFAEFPRSVLEALRQPLEDGRVTIARAAGSVTYPAKFMLLAAVNPCPCGNLGARANACQCSAAAIRRYEQRLSGPILDRIDIHVFVPQVPTDQLVHTARTPETSSSIKERVVRARNRQYARRNRTKSFTNSELSARYIRDYIQLNPEAKQLLSTAVNKYHLSARSYFRILKVAHTIADLADSETIEATAILEALQYRTRVHSQV